MYILFSFLYHRQDWTSWVTRQVSYKNQTLFILHQYLGSPLMLCYLFCLCLFCVLFLMLSVSLCCPSLFDPSAVSNVYLFKWLDRGCNFLTKTIVIEYSGFAMYDLNIAFLCLKWWFHRWVWGLGLGVMVFNVTFNNISEQIRCSSQKQY
jgi:hypothetical protein